jgi:hypothetical protein
MFKKLLLCFSLVTTENQIIQSSECFDEGFASRCDKTLWQQAVATVKSDLCLCKPEDVVQHNTLTEQLLTAARFTVYSMATCTLALKVLGDRALGDKNTLAAVAKAPLILKCFIGPIYEEIIFTYGPQLRDRDLEEEHKIIRGFWPVAASIAFGLAHIQASFAFNIITALSCYSMHRYLSKRPLNFVPFYRHILHNTLCCALSK